MTTESKRSVNLYQGHVNQNQGYLNQNYKICKPISGIEKHHPTPLLCGISKMKQRDNKMNQRKNLLISHSNLRLCHR